MLLNQFRVLQAATGDPRFTDVFKKMGLEG
jgi:hypothetical protein